ncbi:MAG TPA: adenylate/guanylate cyclase domain-containing protein [Acidimicrobiales bacterium]|nr:adenylate/guanylate cyclase domain-containing protein [Acidimicrobiales bacterium]
MASTADEPGALNFGLSSTAAGPAPVRRRLGVRQVSTETQRRLGKTGGFLYGVTGLAGVQAAVAGADELVHAGLLAAISVLAVVVGFSILLLVHLVGDEVLDRLFAPLVLVMLPAAAPLITLALYGAGSSFTVGTITYMIAPIFAVYLFSRSAAVGFLAAMGVQYAVLVSVQDGLAAPTAQWVYLMSLMVATAALVGTFIDRADQLAHSEREARAALAVANEMLEGRVEEQVGELDRLGRLRRFLSPQIAEAVLSAGDDDVLAPHRREIAVLFSDLRGFTGFAGRVEPEEVLDVLHDYYRAVGEVVRAFDATVGHFDGDGVMAYFNDPVPCEDPAGRAVEMALALREAMAGLCQQWSAMGYDLGFGTGIAFGHATLGVIGFEGRSDYTPLGTVVNLGSRLCDEAGTGQVMIDQRVRAAVRDRFPTDYVGDLPLKGFSAPVPAYEVR